MANAIDPLVRQIKGECNGVVFGEYHGRAIPWLVEQQLAQIKKACDVILGGYDALRTAIEVCAEAEAKKGDGDENH